MTVGTHGSTYGGNPLGMAAAEAMLDVVAENISPKCTPRATGCAVSSNSLSEIIPICSRRFRGIGLMIGTSDSGRSRASSWRTCARRTIVAPFREATTSCASSRLWSSTMATSTNSSTSCRLPLPAPPAGGDGEMTRHLLIRRRRGRRHRGDDQQRCDQSQGRSRNCPRARLMRIVRWKGTCWR